MSVTLFSPQMRRYLRPVVYGILLLALVLVSMSGVLAAEFQLAPAPAVALTILLLAAFLWITELVPLFVTSLLILLLNVVWLAPVMRAGGSSVGSEAFTAPFFSNVILLFLGGFTLSAAFAKYLIAERLARWVLGRTGTRPTRVLLGMMVTTAFLSMWMSNTASAAMMLGLAGPLLNGVAEEDPYRKAMVLGIPFAANFGGLGTPIGTPPNAIAIEYMERVDMAPSFARWMLLSAPLLLAALSMLWVVLIKLFPARVQAVEMAPQARFRWSMRSRTVAIVAAITVLAWLSGGLHGIPSGVVALFPVVALFGAKLLQIDDFRRLSWDVLVLAGGGMSLGVAVEQSGLGAWVVSAIQADGMGFWALAIVMVLLAAVMTSVMSNTATANLLIPVVLGFSGVPTSAFLMLVACTCSCIMVLPVSTPPNAMVFATGMVTARDMVRPGMMVSALALVITMTIGLWWWRLCGLF